MMVMQKKCKDFGPPGSMLVIPARRKRRMSTRPQKLVEQIQQLARRSDAEGLSDGDLLRRFVTENDADALARLIRRLGPMVWGLSQRLLRDTHDAEDVFQTTFLVLLRKAHAI